MIEFSILILTAVLNTLAQFTLVEWLCLLSVLLCPPPFLMAAANAGTLWWLATTAYGYCAAFWT